MNFPSLPLDPLRLPNHRTLNGPCQAIKVHHAHTYILSTNVCFMLSERDQHLGELWELPHQNESNSMPMADATSNTIWHKKHKASTSRIYNMHIEESQWIPTTIQYSGRTQHCSHDSDSRSLHSDVIWFSPWWASSLLLCCTMVVWLFWKDQVGGNRNWVGWRPLL